MWSNNHSYKIIYKFIPYTHVYNIYQITIYIKYILFVLLCNILLLIILLKLRMIQSYFYILNISFGNLMLIIAQFDIVWVYDIIIVIIHILYHLNM